MPYEDRIIFDDEEMVGYSNDIAEYLRNELADREVEEDSYDEQLLKLADELDKIDYELVHVIYNPMGCHSIYLLEKKYYGCI